jgi:ketosteroid isomerase-like protein
MPPLKTRAIIGTTLIVFTAALARAQDAPRTAEDSVRRAEFDRRKALLSEDTVLLSRLTGSDFYEVNRLGQIRTRAMNMQEIATGALKLQTVAYDSLSVRLYGDIAILTGIADNTGEFRGMPFTGKIRYTRIFIRRDGRWQAVLMQHTPMP